MYPEEDYLMLSGIQHFAFCRRQWALIHIEQQWAENYRTADGRLMHHHVHDGNFREKRGDVIITRAMKIASAELGISGECDVVEFHQVQDGIALNGLDGTYQVILRLVVGNKTVHVGTHGKQFFHVEFAGGFADELHTTLFDVDGNHFRAAS